VVTSKNEACPTAPYRAHATAAAPDRGTRRPIHQSVTVLYRSTKSAAPPSSLSIPCTVIHLADAQIPQCGHLTCPLFFVGVSELRHLHPKHDGELVLPDDASALAPSVGDRHPLAVQFSELFHHEREDESMSRVVSPVGFPSRPQITSPCRTRAAVL